MKNTYTYTVGRERPRYRYNRTTFKQELKEFLLLGISTLAIVAVICVSIYTSRNITEKQRKSDDFKNTIRPVSEIFDGRELYTTSDLLEAVRWYLHNITYILENMPDEDMHLMTPVLQAYDELSFIEGSILTETMTQDQLDSLVEELEKVEIYLNSVLER